MKNTIQLSLLSIALLSQLNATENQYTLQSIDVTASQGTTLKKKDVTDSVTIITKEAIEESRITTLGEALSQLGNITINQSGGMGQQTSMYLRGMNLDRILVLIDGVRYNDVTTPGAGADISQIMLYNVEQIEIIKGAQSGVWGSDASAGVINIVTSKAKVGTHANLNVEYGSFDTKKTSLQASYATKKFDVLVGGIYLDTDGFSAYEPNKSSSNYGKRYDELGLEKDSYENTSFNAKLGYNITDIDRIEASMQQINGETNFDNSGSDSTIPNSTTDNQLYTLAYKHKSSLHTLNAQYNLSLIDRMYTYEDWTGAAVTSFFKGSINEVKLDDKINYAENSFLRIGASYQLFEQENITVGTNKKYSSIAAFATNYNKFELFSDLNTIFTQSARYDKYDEFDDALTGKIGIKQFLYNDYYVSSNVGTAFKAPTLNQLYGQWGANPDLKPEKSVSADITLGNDTIWITGFYNEIKDYLDWQGAGYTNLEGKSKFRGFELGYEDYLFNTLGLAANYTYVETEDANGKELARVPKSQLDVRAIYYIDDNFDIGANAQYIGTRYDRADKQGAQTGEYTVVNLVSNVKVNKYLTVYGKIDNITDKYYQMVDGYATAGRSLYLGLNAKY
jgi:vitamin B12 transporter